MRDHLFRVAKQSLVYGVGGAALQLIGLVTFPILAREFEPSTYGVLEIGTAVFAVAVTVVDAGFASSAQRSYYDHPATEQAERGGVLTTALAATTALSVVVALVLVALREPISQSLFDESRPGLMTLIAATIVVANAAAFVRQVFRLRLQPWHFTVSAVLSAGGAAVVIVVAVTAFDRGVDGVFLGLLVGNAIGLAYALVGTLDAFVPSLSRVELGRMLRYGLPLLPTALAMWSLMLVDRLMLGRLSSLGEVGQYAAANRVAAVLLLVVTAFATAYGPYALSLYSEDRELEKRVRGRTLTYLTAVLMLVCVGLSLFAQELLAVLAPGYDRAYRGVLLVTLGGVALGISSIVMAGISYTRRTTYFAVLSVAAAAVNIALNLVLIPPFGMVGAAAATAVALGLLTAAYYVVSQRLYPTPYEVRLVVAIVAVGIPAGAVGLLQFDRVEFELLVKLAAVASFLGALYLLGVIRGAHLKELRIALTTIIRSREAT
jgi:O-antigen/teichoic acid export membrane protein